MFNQKKSLLYVAIALLITACGGGGGGGGSIPVVATTPSSGKLVDGYLSGATVFCDLNKNGVADAGEAVIKSDLVGNFKFDPGCTGTIVASGGSDADTGYDFKGTLKAPAGSIVATPLTTLLADTGLTAAQLATALGLPAGTDVTKLDPADGQHAALLKTTLAVQQMIQQLANMFGGLAGSKDLSGLYTKVGAALAKTLVENTGGPLISADGTVNLAVLNKAATGALDSVKADTKFANVAIKADDLAAAAAQIGTQAQIFATASAADLQGLVSKLQNPSATPIDSKGTANYLALQNDSIMINGKEITYAALRTGAAISTPTTVGLKFSVTGTPVIDTTASLALELVEVGGKSRVLQLLIDKVSIKNMDGQVTIAPDASAVINAYGSIAGGTDINLTLKNFTFKPISVVNNTLTLNYKSAVENVLASVDNKSKTVAADFTNLTASTFKITVAVGGLTLRNVADATALPTTTITLKNTDTTVTGAGVTGSLTIQ